MNIAGGYISEYQTGQRDPEDKPVGSVDKYFIDIFPRTQVHSQENDPENRSNYMQGEQDMVHTVFIPSDALVALTSSVLTRN